MKEEDDEMYRKAIDAVRESIWVRYGVPPALRSLAMALIQSGGWGPPQASAMELRDGLLILADIDLFQIYMDLHEASLASLKISPADLAAKVQPRHAPAVLTSGQVSRQRRRAEEVGEPATLTFIEMQAAVAHFDEQCAYCGLPWYLIEHATPLGRGAGSTAANCLPACTACNGLKRSATIEELIFDKPFVWHSDDSQISSPRSRGCKAETASSPKG
jgi:hypothetical protein